MLESVLQCRPFPYSSLIWRGATTEFCLREGVPMLNIKCDGDTIPETSRRVLNTTKWTKSKNSIIQIVICHVRILQDLKCRWHLNTCYAVMLEPCGLLCHISCCCVSLAANLSLRHVSETSISTHIDSCLPSPSRQKIAVLHVGTLKLDALTVTTKITVFSDVTPCRLRPWSSRCHLTTWAVVRAFCCVRRLFQKIKAPICKEGDCRKLINTGQYSIKTRMHKF
jgi:hypothetical protein